MAKTKAGRGGSVGFLFGFLALILFVAGPLVALLEVAAPLTGFYIFAGGGALGAIGTLVSVVTIFRRGFGAALRGLVLSGLVVGAFVYAAMQSPTDVPRINDITTDTENPPKFVKALNLPANVGRDMTYPQEFRPQQEAHYKELAPLTLAGSKEAVFGRVRKAVRKLPTTEITRVDPVGLAIEGTSTSAIFRFRDDFVIEVTAKGPQSAVVNMRSKSRDGKSDLGANAARIEALFDLLR